MNKLRILGLAGILSITGVASAGTIDIAATGQNVSGGLDQNYQITQDSTGQYTGSLPGDAVVVTSQPPAWDTLAGTQWIGPTADEALPASCYIGCDTGTTTYQTTFSVTDPANTSLYLALLVDNAVNIILNGTQVYQVGSNNTYQGFFAPAIVPITSNFISGTNTLQFVVENGWGPTGLDVANAPEPSTLSLAGIALAAVGLLRFRKRRAA
jgi:hypothetical protein